MSCCDARPGSPLETLPAGLSSLPRQLRDFPEVRRDLLRALGADPGALAGWRPSGERLRADVARDVGLHLGRSRLLRRADGE